MPDTDAPQVEPLTLTLEEALQRLYAKGLTLIPPGDDTDSWGIGVASDSPDEEFDTWHEAVSAVEGVPVVPFPFEDAIASIGDLGLVITRLPTGPWAVKDPHSDDCWFGPTLIGALEAVLPELGAPRDPTAELVEALKDVTAALMAADPKAHFKADVERAEAALARVKGGER